MKNQSFLAFFLLILCQMVGFSAENGAFFSKSKKEIGVLPPTVTATVFSKTNAACAGGLNFVTIQGFGGTPPYTFKRRKLPNPTFATGAQSGVSPKKTFSVTAGTWEFKVTDALGVSGLVQVTFVSPLPLVVSTVLYQPISCFDKNNGIVSVQVTGGVLPYSITLSGQNQSNYGNQSYFYGVSSGVQTPIVVDNNGCMATNVPSITLLNPPLMTVTATVTSNVICENQQGKVSFSSTNTRGNYVTYYYNSYNNYGAVNGDVPNDYPANVFLGIGNYTVVAQDQYGCSATEHFEMVATDTLKIENLVATDAACAAGGSVEFTTSGGASKLQYVVVASVAGNSASYAAETLSERHFKIKGYDGNPLDTGNYYIYLVDSIGCSNTSSIFHIGGTPRVVAYIDTLKQPSCAGKSDGAISVSPYQGKQPFEFSLDSINWQTDSTFRHLLAGKYLVHLRDANGCVGNVSTDLYEPTPVTISIYAPAKSCRAGEIDLSAFGGSQNYTFQQVSVMDTSIKIGLPFILNTRQIFNLDTNTQYRYIATDNNGCLAVSDIQSIPPNQYIPNFRIDSIIPSAINCSPGFGQLIIKGIHAPTTNYYSYYFTGSYYSDTYQDTGIIYPSVYSGFQTFHIADHINQSCFLDTIIYIPTAEKIEIQAALITGSCGVPDVVSYDFCGGKAPYKVELLGFNPSNYQYDVILEKDSFSNQVHCPKKIIASDSSLVCENFSYGDCGILVSSQNITLVSDKLVYGSNLGAANYGFKLPAGSHGFEFNYQDYNAQSYVKIKFGYKINNEPIVYLKLNAASKRVVLNNLSAGDCVSLHLETTEQSVYSYYNTAYVQFFDFAFHTNDSTRLVGQFQNLSASGYYYVQVTDANNCKSTSFVDYYNNQLNLIEYVNNKSTCFGEKNANFQVYATGGAGGYTYQVDNDATFYSPTYAYAIGLGAGNYHVTATDQAGCTVTKTITLTDPPKLKANLTFVPIQCKGGLAELHYDASGGTPPYSYSGESFFAPAADYSYYVIDANNCSAVTFVTVPDAPAITLIVSKLNSGCGSVATGKIGVIGQGGAGGFSYQLNNGAFTTNGNFAGLSAGNYTVIAKDAHGCTQSKSVVISANSIALAAQTTNLPCAGASNGQITLTGSGGSAPYFYKIGNGAFQNNPVFSNLSAGVFVVTAKDANGCTAIAQASVLEPAPISLNPTVTNEVTGGAKGTISVAATGGTPPYLYKIDNGTFQNNPNFQNLVAGNYQISVKDANGCTKSATVSVSLTSGGVITITLNQIQPVSCLSAANGAIFTTVSGGCNTLTYRWYRGNILVGSTEDLTNVPAGEYLLYVFDNCGKTAQIDHILLENASQYIEHLTPDDVASCFIRYKWDSKSSATSYKIFHKKCTETAWQTQNIGLATFFDLPNLTPTTCYDFAVQFMAASCPNDTILTTLLATKSASVSPPVHVTHVVNSKTSATVKWDFATCNEPFARDLVELRYRKVGVATWTVVTLNSSAVSHTLNALAPGACYQYRLRNHFLGGTTWSNFTSIRQFCLPLSALADVSDGENLVENALDPNLLSIEFNVADEPDFFVENNPSKLEFLLFPNPTKDVVQLHFESVDVDNTLIINVLNIAGQKIETYLFEKNTRISDEKINVEQLPTGLYFLEIKNGNLRKVVKFVKQN